MQQPVPDPAQVQHMMLAMMTIMPLIGLVATVLMVIPFWQIFKKAGMSGAMSLLMIVPLVNVVMLYVLAFSRWKVMPVPEYGAGYPPVGYPPPAAYPPPGYVPAAAYPPPVSHVPPPDPPAAI
jgi:hypothetical protein